MSALLRGRKPDQSTTQRTTRGRRSRTTTIASIVALWLVVALVAFVLLRPSDSSRILTAAENTRDEGTSRVAITTLVDGGVGRAKQRIDANGLIDFATGQTQLEVQVGDPQTETTQLGATTPMLITNSADATYTRLTTWPDEYAWVKSETSDTATNATPDLAAQLDLLVGGVTNIDDLGVETVRGEEARHYVMTVDLEAAVAKADPDRAAEIEALTGTGVQRMDIDIWASDRIHRFRYNMAVNTATDTDPTTSQLNTGATVLTVVEYYDLGAPFTPGTPDNWVPEDGDPSLPQPQDQTPTTTTPPPTP